MSFSRILTHPGSSHKDEFLACCLLLAKHSVPVWRRLEGGEMGGDEKPEMASGLAAALAAWKKDVRTGATVQPPPPKSAVPAPKKTTSRHE